MFLFRQTVPVEDVTYPNAEWIKEHTPKGFTYDAWRMESAAYQLLFVYDQLQERHRSNFMLSPYGAKQAVGFTKSNNWTLWKKDQGKGSFPIPLRTPFTMVERARIKGEVWLVDSQRMKDLDEYKLNGVEFRRKRVEILIPNRHVYQIVNKDHNWQQAAREQVTTLQAWMYIGRMKFWQDHLDAGFQFKPVRIFEPKGFVLEQKYYAFTPLEYNVESS